LDARRLPIAPLEHPLPQRGRLARLSVHAEQHGDCIAARAHSAHREPPERRREHHAAEGARPVHERHRSPQAEEIAMCGVIGLVYEHPKANLGLVAAELLKTLEYRGYDSTGAAIQGDGEDVQLRKRVGAPSVMVHELGITAMSGRAFCGQVRWATFGAVTDENSQPHIVRCKSFLYGAHNGNVTNCDALKAWLTSEGHAVLSDNDGEMVVHTVEHFFARELSKTTDRASAMRKAIVMAATKLEGSYAAVIVDPVTRVMWAIKQGSSLYFGIGSEKVGGS